MGAQAIRERLELRLRALITRDEALSKHLRGQDGRLDEDFSDRVAFTEMDEVIEQLDTDARTEMFAIRDALKRLTEGEYGACLACGEAIPAARLEILPHATHCVGCTA